MYKIISIFLLLFLLQKISVAQDTLPKISVTQLGRKVLVSWTNNFTSVTNINIQRSSDSLRNFTTIGSVLNVKATTNGFVDNSEFNPAQYYRVFISFEGGSYIFSKSHKPKTDTAITAGNGNDNDELMGLKGLKKIHPLTVPVKNLFVPSKYVYTGKENNVIISIADCQKRKYSIKFFEQDGSFLFEIKKITEPYLTLDKVNFIHSGLFNFEVYANGLLVEKHMFFIPKDGQPMPELDIDGHELK